jgi:hypothetical protein
VPETPEMPYMPDALETPERRYRLEIESLDLGMDVHAVLLELIDPQTREPVTGPESARIWAAILPALAAGEPWGLDFFAHVDRVREFCSSRGIPFRETGALVIEQPQSAQLGALIARFAGETFGVRAGAPLAAGDEIVERELVVRGVDAYQTAYPRYAFCSVCDLENGFLTILSEYLWATEVIRRIQSALSGQPVEVARPA